MSSALPLLTASLMPGTGSFERGLTGLSARGRMRPGGFRRLFVDVDRGIDYPSPGSLSGSASKFSASRNPQGCIIGLDLLGHLEGVGRRR